MLAQQQQQQVTNLERKVYYVYQSDSLIQTLLSILSKRDLITEQSSKYLIQFFQFFNFYCSLGLQQCLHLMRCDVPLVLMQFALDELQMTSSNLNLSGILASSSSITSSSFSLNYSKPSNNQNNSSSNNNGCTSQYADLNKLYCVVSTLLRCYDVSPHCCTMQQHAEQTSSSKNIPTNPFSHQNELKQQQQQENTSSSSTSTASSLSIKLPVKIEEMLFKRSSFFKKLLEDAATLEETIKLMKFLCWENVNFSLILLNELLWMAAYHYSYELKPHLEMLYHILCINDSWQMRRIICVLNGMSTEREGLFEIIVKSQNHYQKRAYQIIKMLVQLFSTCEAAVDFLNKDDDMKRKWRQSRNWLFNEMEKVEYFFSILNYFYKILIKTYGNSKYLKRYIPYFYIFLAALLQFVVQTSSTMFFQNMNKNFGLRMETKKVKTTACFYCEFCERPLEIGCLQKNL